MTDYYWDITQYPACVHPEPEETEEEMPAIGRGGSGGA